jgi:translation initiation factor eIF-2B subunit delta
MTGNLGGVGQPAKQVVGFHVEGASPSPTPPSLLQGGVTAGSPTPVIIPPVFQVAR